MQILRQTSGFILEAEGHKSLKIVGDEMNKNNKPFLLTLAVERSHHGTDKIFHYDYERDENVLDANPAIPFIDAGHCAALQTITKSDRECDSDDDRIFSELYTKTDEIREQDDEELNLSKSGIRKVFADGENLKAYTELYTKTEDDRETDDEDPDPSPWLYLRSYQELVSKTFADRERDDDDDIISNNFISAGQAPLS